MIFASKAWYSVVRSIVVNSFENEIVNMRRTSGKHTVRLGEHL